LTGLAGCGNAPAFAGPVSAARPLPFSAVPKPQLHGDDMVKPEWGTKRACPKCNTRFYDLGKDDPVACISCGFAWAPEPILKSKQTTPFEQAKPLVAAGDDPAVAVDEDLDLDTDVEAGQADADVDLGDDDDLGVVSEGQEEDN
jgi:uncharacterized protein (TIGR02300 family)